MTRRELVKEITAFLRKEGVKKPLAATREVFYISDSEGTTKEFVVKKPKKDVIYTIDDVDAVITACIEVVEKSLQRGEDVTIRGFGTLGLRYRKERATKKLGTEEWITVPGRYIPKFTFGNNLRRCAKLYEISLQERKDDIAALIPTQSCDKDGD